MALRIYRNFHILKICRNKKKQSVIFDIQAKRENATKFLLLHNERTIQIIHQLKQS